MAENESTKRSARKPLLIGGLALLVLAAVVAVVLVVDPFGWNLLDKASGLQDEAASAMPPTVGLYAGIDLINFSEEALTEFSQPFVTALAEPGVEDLGSGLERLDASLAEQIGLTLSDDVRPWLGRSVGLGVTDLALRPDGRIDRVGWLLVAGTQDRRAADEFLDRLSQQLSQRSGLEPLQSEYRGRDITSFGPDEQLPLGGLAFSRSAGQLILGSDDQTVRAAIDAQQGDSLADAETFRRLSQSLPEGRGMTLYADQARLPALRRLMAAAAPLAVGPLDLTGLVLPPGAVGVSIVDQGLRLDTAALAADQGTGAVAERHMAGLFPGATLAFISGESLDATWQSLKAALAAGGNLADFEESMALLSREFGYEPDQKLLPLLDGEWTLALLPADEGLVSALTGQSLGAVLLAGGDGATLSVAVDDLNQALEGQRLPLQTIDLDGVKATTVDLAWLVGAQLPLYGVDGDYLFLGTDAQLLSSVLEGDSAPGGSALADNPGYQAAVALLPAGYQVGFHVDVSRLAALLGDGSSESAARLLAPVERVIAGSGPVANGVRSGVLFIVID